MKKYDVHGTMPVVVTITIEAENGKEAIEIAAKNLKESTLMLEMVD